MLRSNNMSKSTKRRRLLEELNFIQHLTDGNDLPETNDLVELDNPSPLNAGNNIPLELNNDYPIEVENCNTEIMYNTINDKVTDHIGLSTVSNTSNLDLNVRSVDDNGSATTQQPFSSKLIQWATEHNVPNNTFDSLLKVINTHKCFNDLPVSSRTFYKTYSGVSYNNPVEVKTVSPGIYYHFGVQYSIKKYIDKQFSSETIKLVIGIDGLPLMKSSGSAFWPILGYIRQENETVFPIGIYWGYNKPDDSNVFLNDFVAEIRELVLNGIDVELLNNNILTVFHKKVIVDTFCCDAPARAFVLKTKTHTGFCSCARCTVKGQYVERRVCFSNLQCSMRTHEDFINKIQRQYHSDGDATTIISIPNFDVVHNFSLDYMHVVCLGVVKKILMLWKGTLGIGRRNVNNQKLNNRKIRNISDRLMSFKTCIPCDFVRKARSLDELARWKATEYRLFLLYVGVVSIHSIVPKKLYQNFLSLSVAMTIYLSPNYRDLAEIAKYIMLKFVKDFGSLYGNHFISHNVHALIHLFDDYNSFGSLDSVSCFKFENYMGQLKKLVRKSDKPLQQVVRRFEERSSLIDPPIVNLNNPENETLLKLFKMEHNEGPLISDTTSPQFKILILDKIKIKINVNADSFVGLHINSSFVLVKVINICYSQSLKNNVILGRKFNKLERFFEKPIKSDEIGIYKVSNFSKSISIYKIEDIFTKYMVLTTHDLDFSVALPIIHFNT